MFASVSFYHPQCTILPEQMSPDCPILDMRLSYFVLPSTYPQAIPGWIMNERGDLEQMIRRIFRVADLLAQTEAASQKKPVACEKAGSTGQKPASQVPNPQNPESGVS